MTTFNIPAEALAPKQLCGVRFCAIRNHWQTTHHLTLRDEWRTDETA